MISFIDNLRAAKDSVEAGNEVLASTSEQLRIVLQRILDDPAAYLVFQELSLEKLPDHFIDKTPIETYIQLARPIKVSSLTDNQVIELLSSPLTLLQLAAKSAGNKPSPTPVTPKSAVDGSQAGLPMAKYGTSVALAAIILIAVAITVSYWRYGSNTNELVKVTLTFGRSEDAGPAVETPFPVVEPGNGKPDEIVVDVDKVKMSVASARAGYMVYVVYKDSEPAAVYPRGSALAVHGKSPATVGPINMSPSPMDVYVVVAPRDVIADVRSLASATSAAEFPRQIRVKLKQSTSWYVLEHRVLRRDSEGKQTHNQYEKVLQLISRCQSHLVKSNDASENDLEMLTRVNELLHEIQDALEPVKGTSPPSDNGEIEHLEDLRDQVLTSYPLEAAVRVASSIRSSADARAADELVRVIDLAPFESIESKVTRAKLQHAVGSHCYSKRDIDQAEKYFRDAVRTRISLSGVDPWDAARTQFHLGMIHDERGKRERPQAIEEYRTALGLLGQEQLDEISLAVKLRLALAECLFRDSRREAITHLEEADELVSKVKPLDRAKAQVRIGSMLLDAILDPLKEVKKSSDSKSVLDQIAQTAKAIAESKELVDRSRSHLEHARSELVSVLGSDHEMVASLDAKLAYLDVCSLQNSSAWTRSQKALRVTQQITMDSAADWSADEHLRVKGLLQKYLDAYLSVTVSIPRDESIDRNVYADVLHWKGAGFARAVLLQRSRSANGIGAGREFQELQKCLAERFRLSTSDETDSKVAWGAVNDRIVKAQHDLARAASAIGMNGAWPQRSLSNIQKSLSPTSVLVDFVCFRQHYFDPGTMTKKEEDAMLVFVIRSDSVVLIQLRGFDQLCDKVAAWRRASLPGALGTFSRKDHRASAAEIRKLVWDPIEPFLAGVTRIYVSPDGPLCVFPLSALPGSREGTSLISDYEFALVLAPGSTTLTAQPEATSSSLLTVTDILPGPIGNSGLGFKPLSKEVTTTIEKSAASVFPPASVTILRNTGQSELLRSISGKHSILLLTHGVYAENTTLLTPATLNAVEDNPGKSVLPSNPNDRSFLVLRDGNRSADGILTAAAISEFDLSAVENVIVASCQAGDGQPVIGDGTLSIQRAFLVAGASEVIAPVWTVDQLATCELLTQYFVALPSRNFDAISALCEAQRKLAEGKAGAGELDLPQHWAGWNVASEGIRRAP